jgi:hypothetical protein
MKSFKPKDPPTSSGPRGGGRNAPADFKSEERSNKTHRSTTDPDARLYRKGSGMEAKLCFIGAWADGEPLGPYCRRQVDPRLRPSERLAKYRFAADSPLEGNGFELPVPVTR